MCLHRKQARSARGPCAVCQADRSLAVEQGEGSGNGGEHLDAGSGMAAHWVTLTVLPVSLGSCEHALR